MVEKVYSFMGLAVKAGKLVSGDDQTERAIRTGKAQLVVIAEDASANTKKKFTDMCGYRNVNYRIYGSRELLGKYTGKDIRAVVTVTSKDFAKHLAEMIDKLRLENGGGRIGEG